MSEGNCFYVVSSSRLKELEDEARASRAREEVRVVGSSGTTHRPLQLSVMLEEVTRVTGQDLSTTAQGFVQGLASGNNRASTPNSGGDASVILAGTAGPVPSQGSTVVVQDQTQPPPPSQTESSSSVQTRPPSGQAASSGPSAPAPLNVSVQPPSVPIPPPSSSQTQTPPGVQADSTPTNQVSFPFWWSGG